MFSRIYLRVFCYPTEDEIKVKNTLLFVAFGQTDPLLQKTILMKTSSAKHRVPVVFELILEKNRDIKKFVDRLQQINIPKKYEKRIDDNCYLFLRFSKQDSLQKKMKLIEHGDTIFCKAKIRVFPSKRNDAIGQFRKYFLEV